MEAYVAHQAVDCEGRMHATVAFQTYRLSKHTERRPALTLACAIKGTQNNIYMAPCHGQEGGA